MVGGLITMKDSNGRWFEYIYAIQSDEQGRLLMIGRIEDAINQLYVIDANARPLVTLDLAHGYTAGATMIEEYFFLSEAGNDEIAMLNYSGKVLRRFKTNNKQHPYLPSQQKLFAVTQDAVLVYDLADIVQTHSP